MALLQVLDEPGLRRLPARQLAGQRARRRDVEREVLFWGAGALQELLVGTVASAPDSTAPINAVATALEAVGPVFQERREYSRRRQAVIDANPELRERELIKLATLASAIAGALRKRGVSDPAASLTAEAGIAVFKIAFMQWVYETGPADLPQIIREALDELKAVTAGKLSPPGGAAGPT